MREDIFISSTNPVSHTPPFVARQEQIDNTLRRCTINENLFRARSRLSVASVAISSSNHPEHIEPKSREP
jgi:hypothetical protein